MAEIGVGTTFIDDRTLDCMFPQCDGCPLRTVEVEAVPHVYPTDAVLDETDPGVVEVSVGEVSGEVVEAVEAAITYKRAGLCRKPAVDVY